MRVGDFITGYYSGVFEITKIQDRYPSNPLISMIKIYNAKFEPTQSKKQYSCDSAYCLPINEYIERELLTLEERKEKLLNFKRHINENNSNILL